MAKQTLVMKFGGTSVGSVDALTKATQIIKDEKLRKQARHEINELILSLLDQCKSIAALGESSPRALDAVASLGERMSIHLLSAVVQSAGIKARAIESTELIVTNDHYQNAH